MILVVFEYEDIADICRHVRVILLTVDALLQEGLAAQQLDAAAAAAFAADPYAESFSLAPFREAPHSSPLGPGASAAAVASGWGRQGGADAGVIGGESSSVSDVSASADSESSEDPP